MRDELQNEFVLQERIGSGGQGEVWSLEGGRAAAKFLRSADSAARDELRARLRQIARTDLHGIPLATPQALIDGPPGYIMELLEDMVSLGSLFTFPKTGDHRAWYRDTGGLRRRLVVLANMADALHRLHSKAMAYCDLSPANVLVPRSAAYDHIWLIDPDNLSAESDRSAHSLHTRGFGAPEVVRGERANDTLSDLFSLALIVFRVLVNNHPFDGDAVRYDSALADKAYSGGLPWIYHPTDHRNKLSKGMSRDLVLTGALKRLAGQAFEAGLDDPAKRPTAAEWRDQLLRAADFTYLCSGCGNTAYAFDRTCSWCGEGRPPLMFAHMMAHMPRHAAAPDPVAGLVALSHIVVLTRGKAFAVDARRALLVLDRGHAVSPVSPGEPVAELVWHDHDDVEVRRIGHHPVVLVNREHSRSITLKRSERRPLPHGASGAWDVHFGHPDELHTVFRVSRDPREVR
ncbi:protein kinase domain-containing protein [Lentzea nigeriaca]|uniref:protein kinase domain-containing protein n=1 Tax=Lentzea nigeriaca TaxID=1128665 RepID=UPI00195CB330|nr:hypothetical protein [Lentzea nigeriaca]MBM7856233.1 DNA-binding helix-hairpin-helix protein with protein kinase domain [Lentzea nigeriaca]